MNKVVDIQERIHRERQVRQVRRFRDKARALQKALQCFSCRFKCAMCGHHLNGTPSDPELRTGALGYVFCDSCRGEFEDYLGICSGEKEAEVFWHNQAWVDMWSAWLDYQQAIHRFMESPEFERLLSELE